VVTSRDAAAPAPELQAPVHVGDGLDAQLRWPDAVVQPAVDEDASAALVTTQVLVVRVGEEWYAVPLERVREVHGECTVSPLPCVPDFILGVVSLRGEVISVSDLGRMTRLAERRNDRAGLPVVVLENAECATAMVVDELGDIADVPLASVEPSISTIDRYQAAFLLGSLETGGRMVGLLNVDRVLEPVGGKPRNS